MSSRRDQKMKARADRLAREAQLAAEAGRKRRLVRTGAVVAAAGALAGAALVIESAGTARPAQPPPPPALRLSSLTPLGPLRSAGSPGPRGPEGVPVPNAPALARTSSGTAPVDGIQCLGNEQLLFHIHVHLTLYVDGAARQVPYGIGINGAHATATPIGPYVASGRCFYWLHTHSADGIIHIESPIRRTFTLGDFFDVWGQRLGPARVGPIAGHVTALYDGRVYRGDPRDLPLIAHAQIQLDVGRPLVAPVTITFPPGL